MRDHSPRLMEGCRKFRTSTIGRSFRRTSSASDLTAAFDWARCELTCDIRPSVSDDLFAADDPDLHKEDMDADTDDDTSVSTTSSPEQAIAYFKEQTARQHRTFVFQIFIFGSYARLVRWDRCQAVISHRFDYHTTPRDLADFVWRYSELDRATGRGWDTSVSLADVTDAEFFEQEVRRAQLMPSLDTSSGTAQTIYKALSTTSIVKDTLSGDYPTYSVRISSHDTWDIETRLLIRRPFFQHPDAFGRATRAYLAYDMERLEFRFFKDSWRPEKPLPRCLSEEAFYTLAQDWEVPDMNLPRVFFVGDVVGREGCVQITTQMYDLQYCRVHCCVLQELLCPLSSFTNSRELALIVLGVIKSRSVSLLENADADDALQL